VEAINLKWHDAMAEMGRYFSKAEAAAGWPASFTTVQIAVLQRPHGIWDIIGIRRAKEFRRFLDTECEKGSLLGEKKEPIRSIQPSQDEILMAINHRQRPVEPLIVGMEIGGNLVNKVISYFFEKPGKTYYFATARDVKAWFESKNENPSEHIKGWFNSVMPPVESAPITGTFDSKMSRSRVPVPVPKNKRRDLMSPLIEAAQRESSDPFDTPAIWATLCKLAEQKVKPLLGKTEEGIKWADGDDEIQYFSLKMLRDRLGRQKAALQKSVKPPPP
jgi:YHS domain-containing protein